jgi:hypothetical protein
MSAILELSTDCLTSPTRLHVATIEAMMLWPHDEKARREALAASTIEFLIGVADCLPREELLTLVLMQQEALRIKELKQKSLPRFLDGVRAGRYLQETVGSIALDRRTKMESIAAAVTASLAEYSQIDAKTFATHIWKHYRPVAHLWAASFDFAVSKVQLGIASAFPCAAAELGDFLGLAEGYRLIGESTRARQSRHTILDLAETVKLPPGLDIVAITPQFEAREMRA